MTVLRIVPKLAASEPRDSRDFWSGVFGLGTATDVGWIVTFGAPRAPQVSAASKGGSGTEVPAVSVEVDDLDAAFDAAREGGHEIVYGPLDEPWGVRRSFFVRAPSGHVVNALCHT